MNKSVHLDEVIFVAVENLYEHEKLKMVKNMKKYMDFIQGRTAQSYCYEFSGSMGISFHSMRFEVEESNIEMEKGLLDPVQIEVQQLKQERYLSPNTLRPALYQLLNKGIFSDLIISFKGEQLPCHKCILMCRSGKLRAMLETPLKESQSNVINITEDECSLGIYKSMLCWIYAGDCKLPDNLYDVIQLMRLADQYFLDDLIQECMDLAINLLDYTNVVSLLTDDSFILPIKCEDQIFPEAKHIFVAHFPRIIDYDPAVESKIASKPGLISSLFLQLHNSGGSLSRGKLRLLDKANKKRVRFKISNSIYSAEADIEGEPEGMAHYDRISLTQSDIQSLGGSSVGLLNEEEEAVILGEGVEDEEGEEEDIGGSTRATSQN